MEGVRSPGLPRIHAPSAGAHERDPVAAAVGIAALATAAAIAAASRTVLHDSRLRQPVDVVAATTSKFKKTRSRKIESRRSKTKEPRTKKSSKASSNHSSAARARSKSRKPGAPRRTAKSSSRAGARERARTRARSPSPPPPPPQQHHNPTTKKSRTHADRPLSARVPALSKHWSGDQGSVRTEFCLKPHLHPRDSGSTLRTSTNGNTRAHGVPLASNPAHPTVTSSAPTSLKHSTRPRSRKSLTKKASSVAVPSSFTVPSSRLSSPSHSVVTHLSSSYLKTTPLPTSRGPNVPSCKRQTSGRSRQEDPASSTIIRASFPPAEKPAFHVAKGTGSLHRAATSLLIPTPLGVPLSCSRSVGVTSHAHGVVRPSSASAPAAAKRVVKSASHVQQRRASPRHTRRPRSPSFTRGCSNAQEKDILETRSASKVSTLVYRDFTENCFLYGDSSHTIMRQEFVRDRIRARHLASQEEGQQQQEHQQQSFAPHSLNYVSEIDERGAFVGHSAPPSLRAGGLNPNSGAPPAPATPPARATPPLDGAPEDASPSLLALREAIFHSDEPFLADHPRSPSPSRARVQEAEQSSRSRASVCSSPAGVYNLKRVDFGGRRVPIVTQNANGPCPLIAVANTLLLRGRVVIPDLVAVVSTAQLVEYVSDAVTDAVVNIIGEGDVSDRALDVRANAVQNAHDAIAVLPELEHGLDVNVRFGGVRDFEPTRECAVFDVLRIPLYHGWLVDPQCAEAARAVGRMSYNELVEFILANKSSADQRLAASALQAEEFLSSTATQLTYHGLYELTQAAREGEVAVFFRNNHFSTLYKYRGSLYLLVTDQGFLHETAVAWETLSSIDGESAFVDGLFKPASVGSGGGGGSAALSADEEAARRRQIESDEALARAFAAEERLHVERARGALRAAQAQQTRVVRPDTRASSTRVPSSPAPAPVLASASRSTAVTHAAAKSSAHRALSGDPSSSLVTPSSYGTRGPHGTRAPRGPQDPTGPHDPSASN